MFKVEKCRFTTTAGEFAGYMIENRLNPVDISLMLVNRFLHVCALKSDQTARQYAYRLCKWLEWLSAIGLSFLDAEDEHIVRFMHSLQYDLSANEIDIRQRISPQALAAAYNPIRGLYIYLYECRIPIKVTIDLIRSRIGKNSYLQGIAPALPQPDMVLDQSWEQGSNRREYIRWYTEEQKEALLSACRTLRDKSIISIGLDGFRIDEILSSRVGDYDSEHGLLMPYRSKRRQDGEETRCAPLSDRSVQLLEDYCFNERSIVESEIEAQGRRMPDELFVVLRHGESFGQPLSYRSFWETLKSIARRAGLDPELIRTHSGRSTRANEIVTDMAKHPGKWTDKEFKDVFGWKSMSSADPYINRNDQERQLAVARKLREVDAERENRYGKDD